MILVATGLSSLASFAAGNPVSVDAWIAVVLTVIGLVGGLRILRARTVRVWREGAGLPPGNVAHRRAVARQLAVHLALDACSAVSLMLYLGVTSGAQRWALNRRCRPVV